MSSLLPAAGRACVVGSGVAGLLAARVLADHFAEVTIVDRRRRFESATVRSNKIESRPAPQFPQGLLQNGVDSLETLLPGIVRELAWAEDAALQHQPPPANVALLASEAAIGQAVRRRIQAFPNVEFVPHLDARGIHIERGRIAHVRFVDLVDSQVRCEPADVVVDATGVRSQLPQWLSDLKLPQPPEQRMLRSVYECHALSEHNVQPLSRWTRRLHQMLSNVAFDWGLPNFCPRSHIPESKASVAERGRCRPVYRRSYDRLRRLPEGLLAIGSSICTTAAEFMQSPTASAIQAVILSRCLAKHRKRLSRRYFQQIRPLTQAFWTAQFRRDR